MKWYYFLILIPVFFLYQGYKIMNAKTSKEKFVMYDQLFITYGVINGIPWKWLKAICKQESDLGQNERVKNNEVSYDGLSYGIMQIAEGNGSTKERELKGNGGKENLNNASYSIKVAAKLVKYLYVKYNGDMMKVFRAYNQGEKNTDNGKDYTHGYAESVKKWLNWIDQKEKEYNL